MNIQKTIVFVKEHTAQATKRVLIGLGIFIFVSMTLVGQVIFDKHNAETIRNVPVATKVSQ